MSEIKEGALRVLDRILEAAKAFSDITQTLRNYATTMNVENPTEEQAYTYSGLVTLSEIAWSNLVHALNTPDEAFQAALDDRDIAEGKIDVQ